MKKYAIVILYSKMLEGDFLTKIIIIINIIVFIFEILNGGSTNTNVLIMMGAKVNELINTGEYYRFITPMFLHIGLTHILMNSYALINTGPFVEKFLGRFYFLIIYLFSGITGNVCSYLFSDTISAGASTAIFGIFGCIVTCGLFFRKDKAIKRTGKNMLYIVIVNLILNIFQPGIDIYGHLGGFLGGVLMTTIILLFKTSNTKVVKL